MWLSLVTAEQAVIWVVHCSHGIAAPGLTLQLLHPLDPCWIQCPVPCAQCHSQKKKQHSLQRHVAQSKCFIPSSIHLLLPESECVQDQTLNRTLKWPVYLTEKNLSTPKFALITAAALFCLEKSTGWFREQGQHPTRLKEQALGHCHITDMAEHFKNLCQNIGLNKNKVQEWHNSLQRTESTLSQSPATTSAY